MIKQIIWEADWLKSNFLKNYGFIFLIISDQNSQQLYVRCFKNREEMFFENFWITLARHLNQHFRNIGALLRIFPMQNQYFWNSHISQQIQNHPNWNVWKNML